MHPYWFEIEGDRPFEETYVGLTARSDDDALAIFNAAFNNARISKMTVIQDISEIDDWTRPRMGNWFKRGIWYPKGHDLPD